MSWRDVPCKLWRGRPGSDEPWPPTKYGKTSRDGRYWLVHRLAWTEQVGPIPEGMGVLHRCDTPACYEAAHLFLGTQAENVADMDGKGRRRSVVRRGEASPCARLTQEKADAIRAEYGAGARQVDLAERYGVSQSLVSLVVRGEAWAA